MDFAFNVAGAEFGQTAFSNNVTKNVAVKPKSRRKSKTVNKRTRRTNPSPTFTLNPFTFTTSATPTTPATTAFKNIPQPFAAASGNTPFGSPAPATVASPFAAASGNTPFGSPTPTTFAPPFVSPVTTFKRPTTKSFNTAASLKKEKQIVGPESVRNKATTWNPFSPPSTSTKGSSTVFNDTGFKTTTSKFDFSSNPAQITKQCEPRQVLQRFGRAILYRLKKQRAATVREQAATIITRNVSRSACIVSFRLRTFIHGELTKQRLVLQHQLGMAGTQRFAEGSRVIYLADNKRGTVTKGAWTPKTISNINPAHRYIYSIRFDNGTNSNHYDYSLALERSELQSDVFSSWDPENVTAFTGGSGSAIGSDAPINSLDTKFASTKGPPLSLLEANRILNKRKSTATTTFGTPSALASDAKPGEDPLGFDVMKRRLQQLYKIVNPAKVPDAGNIINKYTSKGQAGLCLMSTKLERKYPEHWKHTNPNNVNAHKSPSKTPFIASRTYSTIRPGYEYKKGDQGLGYYLDTRTNLQKKKGLN